jgi:hypothetical protein
LALKAAGYTTGLIFADWAGQVVPEHTGRRAAEAALVRRLTGVWGRLPPGRRRTCRRSRQSPERSAASVWRFWLAC